MKARFILSKKKVFEQYNKLKELGVIVSYSYKTNREVGNILQDTDSEFSIHNFEEINMIKDKKKIWFFLQAESKEEIKKLISKQIKNFVIDNEKDLKKLLETLEKEKVKISLGLRMKFQEHRIGSSKYFVYGMPSTKINKIIQDIKDNKWISKLGVHIHRKSQNTSEWNIVEELKDSLSKSLKSISFLNLGGGLPIKYKSYTAEVLPYIFGKIKEARDFLKEKEIETYIEPGRFICGPAVKLETEIIQIYDKNIVVNTSIYNGALDTSITSTKMLVEGELDDKNKKEKGEFYLIKGNTPTRDDIFRYKVKLKKPKVGNKIIFLNAGAYNYTTDFCCLKKLETEIV